jgi:tetratricopeptide (TPR) repeat protein
MLENRSLELARSLKRQGRTADAESLYREMLQAQPNFPAAIEALGGLLFEQGRTREAAVLFGRLAAIQPDSARSHANAGEAFRLLGQVDQAEDYVRRALALDPAFAQAWNSAGLLALDRGRPADAERAYREAIRLRPSFVAALINLGIALQALGRGREAAEALREALCIEPNNPIALVNLGHVLCERGDPASLAEAAALCRRAAELAPGLPKAVEVLVRVLRREGRFDEAERCERAMRPQAAGSRTAIRTNDGSSPRTDQQRESTRDVPSLEPASTSSSAESHFRRGVTLLRESQHSEAEASFREALRLDPKMADAWVGLSQLQAERGDIELSCESARSALRLRPDLAEAHWRLATTLKGRLPEVEMRAIETLAADESQFEGARSFLNFGLAAVLDDRGRYDQAAAHLETAHRLRSALAAAQGRFHDPEADARFTDALVAAFNADLFTRGRGWVTPDSRPVFVVGLQRSGTTLVEQILASHPQIHGAGELRDVGNIFEALPELVGAPAGDSFDAVSRLGPTSATAAARRYLERLDLLAPPTATRVVDKAPDNIRFLGLIALLWPGARVIVCNRDLRDVAVSCWLTGYAFRWTSNWDHVARRFAAYQRILAHWRRCQPLEWLDVNYEDLVFDLPHHARRLIDFVGLEWDQACLRFHATKRIVRTPSLVQVRTPVYSNSVGRWRRYEASVQSLVIACKLHGVELSSIADDRNDRLPPPDAVN